MALFLPGQPIGKLGQQPGFVHLQQQAGHLTAVLAIAQLRQQELLGRVWQRRKLTELLQSGQLETGIATGGNQQIAGRLA